MPYNEIIAERIRIYLDSKAISFREKRMFGGLCYMVNEKLCVGVDKNRLIARVGKKYYEEALTYTHCIEFDIRKKPIVGYVLIEEEGLLQDEELNFWIEKSLSYIRKN